MSISIMMNVENSMHLTEMSGFTFQQAEVFLAAAKYENFTQAANELNMTQASVSRNIMNLEQSLGLVLFLRHKQRVRLTNAGKSLAQKLPRILQQMDKILEDAFLQQQNQFKSLTIGNFNVSSLNSYLIPITKVFEQKYPEVKLKIELDDPPLIIERLCSGHYDAAFFTYVGIDTLTDANLQYTELFKMPPSIVLAKAHPLFGKENLSRDDLADQSLVIIAGERYKDYRRFVRRVCQETGISYRGMEQVDNLFTLAMELKRGKQIAIMDVCFAPLNSEEFRYVPLENCQTSSGIVLAYSSENYNPYLAKFRSVCMEWVKS
jgi:DNA-binding transcriptional LysR family regulator